ncbi:ATP-binding protein [Levilactobacillus fujinensis]|uniref:AAA family ATPase n=1 Tax=Levilactobacillus fujinensis TaxID=2486024 RepID=A0ABW1TGL7_9LACO|nr:AAA family ATPase [Levilactobacillus fujinensis]
MYLNQLMIYGFGKFHDRTFDLTTGLNVVVGPNEAGKSTLTQFITAVLFGFPTKKHPELRYEPLDGSRFGGEITFTQKQTRYLVTRTDGPHGGTVTLRDLTNALTLPSASLPHLLEPVDEALFTSTYVMNEPRLGTVFSASKQELIDRLRHVGAIGSDFWLNQAQTLGKQADELYKPQGRNPILNQQLQEHQELTAKLAKAKAAYGTYWDFLRQQETQRQQQGVLQQKLDQQRQITAQLERQAASWPTFVQWQQLAQRQPLTTTGFTRKDATELERLTSRTTAMAASLKADQNKLQRLQQGAKVTPLFTQYLAATTQVDPLFEQLTTVKAANETCNQLRANQRDYQQRATAIEQQYASTGQMPRPFSLATHQQVKRLQKKLMAANQKRRQLQQELNRLNEDYRQAQPTRRQHSNPLADKQLGWLAAGLVILIGAMFLPGTIFKLIGALCGVAIGYYGVFIVDGETPASRQLQDLTESIRDIQAQLREGGQQEDALTNQLEAVGDSYGLGQIPVEQWSAAQTAIGEWEHLTQQLQQTAEQLTAQTQTISDFQIAIDQALPELQHQPLTNVLQQLAGLQVMRQALGSQQTELTTVADDLQRTQHTLRQTQQAEETFLRTRNLTTVDDFYRYYQQIREQDNQLAQQQALASQLGVTMRTALQQYATQAELIGVVQQAQHQQQALQGQLDTLTTSLATLAGQLDQLTASGTQAVLQQKLANLEARMTATAQTWLANNLTRQWIAATLAAASGDRLPQIVTQASEFYGKLTENRYTEIELTPNTLRVRLATGEWREVSQLSRGTAEQLDLAVKLAFAVIMNQRVGMPLVIDDGLVNFDEHRRQAAYALLAEIGKTVQVIFLTADVTVNAIAGNLIRLTD